MKSVKEEFKSVKNLLVKVLENYPETRDSDNLLFIQACKLLGAKTIDDVANSELSMISVHKVRQVIQNKQGLFPPSDRVQGTRQKRAKEVRTFMSAYS